MVPSVPNKGPRTTRTWSPGEGGNGLVIEKVFSRSKKITRKKRDVRFACFAEVFGSLFDGGQKNGNLNIGQVPGDLLFKSRYGFEGDPLLNLYIEIVKKEVFWLGLAGLNHLGCSKAVQATVSLSLFRALDDHLKEE